MFSEDGKVEILEKYVGRENDTASYSDEIAFYKTVKEGNTEAVKEILKQNPFEKMAGAELSDDHLQSLKYHFTITAAMLARFCIEGGMEHKRAYELSDKYIRMGDRTRTVSDLVEIQTKMCLDYARKMKDIHKSRIYSKPIVQSIDYIYSHLHCRLTVGEAAKAVGLNQCYYSKLFKKEVGCPPQEYILRRKIDAAKNLLLYSSYSSAEIADLLSFSSQSHFISAFGKYCGVTPREYRNSNFNRLGIEEE
ncbi:MAG: helix-turn-helix domain-containing protein [Ruminococcus sp.]|nr:helix-turn-helix domain-containing protein [Ruminococcus sp.]